MGFKYENGPLQSVLVYKWQEQGRVWELNQTVSVSTGLSLVHCAMSDHVIAIGASVRTLFLVLRAPPGLTSPMPAELC